MSFAIRLTKSGIRCEADGNKEPGVRSCRPATSSELLRFWHRDVGGIDLDYTLGDLMELLRAVGGIDQLADMFSCDIDEFLAEAAVPPAARADDLVHLEVYNSAHLIGWVNGPKGRRISGGRFVPPHRVYRGFQGWGPWESDDTPDGMPPRHVDTLPGSIAYFRDTRLLSEQGGSGANGGAHTEDVRQPDDACLR